MDLDRCDWTTDTASVVPVGCVEQWYNVGLSAAELPLAALDL